MLLCGVIGVLHHTDPVLRFDHSGWPFMDIVTLFTFSLLVCPLFILAFFLRRGGWGRFAIVLTAPLMAEAARFSNLLLSVRCSFFNQGCNLLRPGDINRVTGTLDFDHVALGSFCVPAFEVGIDDSVSCRY